MTCHNASLVVAPDGAAVVAGWNCDDNRVWATGGPPGTIARLTGEMIPGAFETRLSPHQMGLRDLLAVSDLMGNRPPAMTLLGVQPETIEPGTDLSPPVESALDTLVEMALRELRGWGIAALPL